MEEIEKLRKENEELKEVINKLKENLSKYTNPERLKRFYENNKDRIKEKRRERYKKEIEEKKN